MVLNQILSVINILEALKTERLNQVVRIIEVHLDQIPNRPTAPDRTAHLLPLHIQIEVVKTGRNEKVN